MFVVCGEALLDVFVEAETATGLMLDARVGGSPFNVAVGLARMGQRAAFLGGLAHDFLGERLMAALAREGVDTALVARVPAPATLGFVGLGAQGVPSYAFYGEGAADRVGLAVPPALRAEDAVLVLGSYTLVVEPAAAALRTLVEREQGRRLVVYDPNVRLTVMPEVARWRDALQWMLPRTQLLKVSEEDLQLMHPGLASSAFAAASLAAGVRLVVVTRGGEGVAAWTATATVEVPAQPVEVADTVGAGDTFQAALLCWLAERGLLQQGGLAGLSAEDLRAALTFASQAAAITCSRRGADLPRRAELPA
jgi:fructokinase